VRTNFKLKAGHFEESTREPTVTLVDYRDGAKAAIYSVRDVGWMYAGAVEGKKDPTLISAAASGGALPARL
jgi:hypothetical protein